MSAPKHTPLPWRATDNGRSGWTIDGPEDQIAELGLGDSGGPDAEHIVACVNAAPATLAELEAAEAESARLRAEVERLKDEAVKLRADHEEEWTAARETRWHQSRASRLEKALERYTRDDECELVEWSPGDYGCEEVCRWCQGMAALASTEGATPLPPGDHDRLRTNQWGGERHIGLPDPMEERVRELEDVLRDVPARLRELKAKQLWRGFEAEAGLTQLKIERIEAALAPPTGPETGGEVAS